jgi:glycosyltransferase involved in cell wall biosynthesis
MCKVLIIGYVWPEPRSSAAGSHMMSLIRAFRAQQWHVTFATPAALSSHMADLAAEGVDSVAIALNDSSFDRYVAELAPDIVLFDRFMMEEQFGWRVEQQCPDALRILDTEDLHCLRNARHSAVKQQREITPADLFSEMAQREVAAIYRCDLTLMISSYEHDLLTQRFGVPAALLHHLPFMLDPARLNPPRPGFDQRAHFISIGNFRHAPNWDAVLWLKQQIWPRIRRQLPEAELHVYGAYPPPKATALHNAAEGFCVKGWVDDADAAMAAARVCVAPLRFGAGIKGKLAEAMLNGTPSVTTPTGAEAMHGGLPWPGEIAAEPDALANAAVSLYQDQTRWQQAQLEGDRIIRTLYDGATLSAALIARIQQLREQLPEHRLANFTGAMLRHHHHRSTQFMSQWIEVKNRLAAVEAQEV